MDEAKKAALVASVRDRGGDEQAVAVTIEEFFDGNDDLGSIAPNLGENQPPLERFRDVLTALRDRADVSAVWVELDQLEWDEYPDGEWPYAPCVGVVTSLPSGTIDELTADLLPDPAGDPSPIPEHALGAVDPSHHYVMVWWD